MDTPDRPSPAVVTRLGDAIAAVPERFALRQMLRLLRRLHGTGGNGPGAPAPFVLRGNTSMDFPAAEVAAFAVTPDGRPGVTTPVDALTGATGSLPNAYRDAAAAASAGTEPADDDGFLLLLGVFEQRLGELSQAVWEAGSFAVREERDDPDGAALALRALIGTATEPARDPDLRGFAAVLQPGTRGLEGLGALVSELLGVPVAVTPYHGRWLTLPAPARCRLGLGGHLLGRQVWDRAGAVSLRIGPCQVPLAAALLEAPPRYKAELAVTLAGIAEQYLHGGVTVHVEVSLAEEAVPRLRLGRRESPLTPRLGRSAWLRRPQAGQANVSLWL